MSKLNPSSPHPHKKNHFWAKKKKWILGIFIALIIAARLLLPGFLLNHLNSYLASFSPLYEMHIERLHLHIYRMAYSFDDVQGKLKKDSFQFMNIQKIDISLAWHELLHGRIVTNVKVEKANLKLTVDSLHAVEGYGLQQAKKDAKNVKDATIPFDLSELRFQDSRIEFSDVAGLPPEQNFVLDHLNALANNVTPADQDGTTTFNIVAMIQENSAINVNGKARMKHTPLDWSTNIDMKDFTLSKINPIARRMVPLTFKTGSLTLYASAESIKGDLHGYLKPFLKDLVFVGDRGDFKNLGQFFIEIAGTIGNFFLKNSKTHALATKISFKTEKGKLDVDTGKALSLALKNGFGKALKQNYDQKYELP